MFKKYFSLLVILAVFLFLDVEKALAEFMSKSLATKAW